MAILCGPIQFTGKLGPVTAYRVGDKIHMRKAGGHSRKRILKDPAFENFRRNSGYMKYASPLASQICRALPKAFRQRWMYNAFVQEALEMIKRKGMNMKEVYDILYNTYTAVRNKEAIKKENVMEEKAIIAEDPVIEKKKRTCVRRAGHILFPILVFAECSL